MSDPRTQKRWKREHRKRAPEPAKPPDPWKPFDSSRFAFKEGAPFGVLRPKDAARKLVGLERLYGVSDRDGRMFDELLTEQPHQFLGYLGCLNDDGGVPPILDGWGKEVGRVQPGDSFVRSNMLSALPAFMLTGSCHLEWWNTEYGRVIVTVLPRPDLKADSNTGIVTGPPDCDKKGSIAMRGGIAEPDCHIPILNRIWTGDPDVYWKDCVHAAESTSTASPCDSGEETNVE
jgi:hypothetical protein